MKRADQKLQATEHRDDAHPKLFLDPLAPHDPVPSDRHPFDKDSTAVEIRLKHGAKIKHTHTQLEESVS